MAGTAAPPGDLRQRLAADLEDAYPALVRAHADAVYGAALRLSGSPADADDIAQETFVRAYRALRRYDVARRRTLHVRPWLLTITVNLWRNERRRAARRPVTVATAVHNGARAAPGLDPPDAGPGPEDRALATDAGRALAALLLRLPPHHRAPLVLHHVAGLTYPEVATTLRCPVGTAKANAARGLERLRALATTPTEEDP